MRFKKALILIVMGLATLPVLAQQRRPVKKSSYSQGRFNNSARVRGKKAKIVCPVFEDSKYPYHGIGFKLGDPFAFTYKYYARKHFAVVADFGKAASGLYSRYFREKFDGYVQRDTFSTSEAAVNYLTHKVKSDLVGEIKFLYQVDVSKISPGLQAYIGAGWEFKQTKIEYDYLFSGGNAGLNQVSQFGRFSRTRTTMGPQAVMGIEYAYFRIPVSAFMELEYFSDVQADPGRSRIEGGAGLRYIF